MGRPCQKTRRTAQQPQTQLWFRVLVLAYRPGRITANWVHSPRRNNTFSGLVLSSLPKAASNSLTEATSVLANRSEEHTSELQSQSNLVCRLLLEKNIS